MILEAHDVHINDHRRATALLWHPAAYAIPPGKGKQRWLIMAPALYKIVSKCFDNRPSDKSDNYKDSEPATEEIQPKLRLWEQI
jgi:hypothetical protein